MAQLYAEWPITIGIARSSEFYIDVADAAEMWDPFRAIVWPGVEGRKDDVAFRPSRRFAMLVSKETPIGRFMCLPPTAPFMWSWDQVLELEFSNEGAAGLMLVFGATQSDYLTDDPAPMLASWSTRYSELGLPVVERSTMTTDAFTLQFVEAFNKIGVPSWPSPPPLEALPIVMPDDMSELLGTSTSASKRPSAEQQRLLDGVYIPEGW